MSNRQSALRRVELVGWGDMGFLACIDFIGGKFLFLSMYIR